MLSPSTSRTYARLGVLTGAGLISFLLVSRYELAQPQNRPRGITGLGSQAWQASFEPKKATTSQSEAVKPGLNATTATNGGYDDYWDEEDETDYWSISSNRHGWDPLRADTTPFTELALKTCVLSPGLYDMCSPISTAKEDQLRGKWERIDRDVSKKVGIYYLYLYGRRLLPGSGADVITNLRISPENQPEKSWTTVPESLRTGVWPRLPSLYLQYSLASQSDILAARKMSSGGDAGELEPITEIDVIYGANETNALPGYTKISPMITGGPDDDRAVGTGYDKKKKGTRVGSNLAYRKQIPVLPSTPVLRFTSNGNFTVLQVADLHFSVGPGECRDVDPLREQECRRLGADVYSLEWLRAALEEVKPDLVVLSGDQINGQETSWDARSTILKWAPLLYEREIPWTIVFGNHDHEATDLDHEKQMDLMRRLPYFIGESGPTAVDGTGNYVRSIRAAEEDTVLFNLYFLDSHAKAKSTNPFKDPGYDFLKPSQINWFRGRSSQMKPIMRPYTPKTLASSLSSAFSTKKRPARPRPSSSSSTSKMSHDSRHILSRQQGAREGEDEESWTAAAVEELTKLEQDMLEKGSGGGGGGFSPAVEPDDGSNVEINDDGVSSEFEQDDSAYRHTARPIPVALDVGPTRANPLEAKPNAIVFFHIPLQQAYTGAIDLSPSGKELVIGERLEGAGASKTDSGFFEQAVLAQGELVAKGGQDGDGAVVDEFWDGEYSAPTKGRPEVKVLAHGHCHLSSDCRRVAGVWQCFGGGGTYSGYGNGTFPRRFRVYRLSDYGEKIETYQLLDTKEVVNHAVLVGEGSVEEIQ